MIGPIIFVLFLALLVVAPAIAGWNFSKKRDMGYRFCATILGGQAIVLPAIALIAFSADRANDENPTQTVIYYAIMALVLSVMTLAIMEMRKMRSEG